MDHHPSSRGLSSRVSHLFPYLGPKFSAPVVEFVGTFFLVTTIGCNVVTGSAFAPFAIGSMLMVMVFMGGHISGAHYNPAVTFGVRLTGRSHISTANALIYLVMQLLAGFFGALTAWGLTGATFAPLPDPSATNASTKAFFAEFVYTFALVSVMLNCATTRSQAENSFFGLAIGFTVLSGAYSVGGISGGAFNPAVATGPTILNAVVADGPVKYLWIYWIAELLAAAAASVIFRMVNSKEYTHQTAIAQEGPGTASDRTAQVQYHPLESQE